MFKKEIKPTDHLAFLIIEENLGRICFIDHGIPQFIREFPIVLSSQTEEAGSSASPDELNLKIVNEIGNSFDFYTRQFNGERIDQMLVSTGFVQKNLLSVIETELKVKIKKFSPNINTGVVGANNDMDAMYAMGACITPPLESLSEFNFLGNKTRKSRVLIDLAALFNSYKEIIIVFVLLPFTVALQDR